MDDMDDMDDDEQEPIEEPTTCHTWLHIGGPLDGQVKFYGSGKAAEPPAKTYITVIRRLAAIRRESRPAATYDASYELETVHCGPCNLTVFRFSELSVTELFTAMLRHYAPGAASTRSKMLDSMGRGVSDEELHSYVAGGFGIREMMVHASRMRHELQQRGNDA